MTTVAGIWTIKSTDRTRSDALAGPRTLICFSESTDLSGDWKSIESQRVSVSTWVCLWIYNKVELSQWRLLILSVEWCRRHRTAVNGSSDIAWNMACIVLCDACKEKQNYKK